MPIDIDDLETGAVTSAESERAPEDDELLEFLAFNPEQAYTLREIQGSVDGSKIDIAARLTYLRKEGLVVYKDGYWAIAQPSRNPDGNGAETEFNFG